MLFLIPCLAINEERVIRMLPRDAQYQQPQFQGMVITPHGGFAARDEMPFRNIVPSGRSMVHRMQDQSLVAGIPGEVGIIERVAGNGQARPVVSLPLLVPFLLSVSPQPD